VTLFGVFALEQKPIGERLGDLAISERLEMQLSLCDASQRVEADNEDR
jgi:hypothetical protein